MKAKFLGLTFVSISFIACATEREDRHPVEDEQNSNFYEKFSGPNTQPNMNDMIKANSSILLTNISQAEVRKGLENGKPAYLLSGQFYDQFKFTYSMQKSSKMYMDLWLIKSVSQVFDALKSEGVVGINHMGTYNYRNINGTSNPSRHSYALALDIGGFYMNDGSYISVLNDWNKPVQGKKLKALHALFCKNFDVVLGPDANADHKDHFHIDLNPSLRSTYEIAAPSWDSLPKSIEKMTLVDAGEQKFDGEEGFDLPHGPIDYESIENEKLALAGGDVNKAVRSSYCK